MSNKQGPASSFYRDAIPLLLNDERIRQPMDILLNNFDIITADVDSPVINNGCICVQNSTILYVGSKEGVPQDFKPQRILDGKNKIVMPGFVNAHTHCAMTVMRNYGNDLPLEEWLFGKVFPAETLMRTDDVYWGSLLGIIEMIKSGTTSFADMYLYMDGAVQAVEESGMRANLSISPLKFNAGQLGRTVDDTQKCRDFYKSWNGKLDGRVKVYIEVHSTYLFDYENLVLSAQLASELNTGIQIHLLETLTERKNSFEKYNKSPIEVCLETGIFDVPVVAAHCVHLSDQDLEIINNKRVNVVHNPTSNLKLASGFAPVPAMLDRGINIALGTDGAASNNNLNMMEEMHIASLIHKGKNLDPLAINANKAIRIATTNGADAIGFENEVGKIKNGMKADLIIIDADKPHLCPLNDIESAIVYCAQASDVQTVIVDGEMLMENGILKYLDEERVKFEVRNISKRILNK